MQTFRLAAGAEIERNRPNDEAATKCLKILYPSSVPSDPLTRAPVLNAMFPKQELKQRVWDFLHRDAIEDWPVRQETNSSMHGFREGIAGGFQGSGVGHDTASIRA